MQRHEVGLDMVSRHHDDPLAVLRVIDRMEVGPGRLDDNRLLVPYQVTRGSHTDRNTLVYTYGETLLEASDPGCLNLACMIGAQAALNYGLFCKHIVFRGGYDATDRRFIQDMAENTAKEIYVKKFLQPNPFLTHDVAGLPAVQRHRYLGATISFPEAVPEPFSGPAWTDHNRRCAVLSSGGKESLLSYALLKDIGREVHPVFINESGRHWFTAINAYRTLQQNDSRTARVWTNADRIFNWMLRHLPFVRPDFAEVRSDAYPIRLWTVAVFLFGALPLLRKRRIGRLIIGSEHDTTVRKSFQGITHYDGLYDQNRHFDGEMTRYFHAKGWGVSQFSILRPLSELVIMKILCERYPELQRLQVSCHAAHIQDSQAAPCGRCEKCRRIVGMLLALGHDPQCCGYTPGQVQQCLQLLSEKGTHQGKQEVQQLAAMLHAGGHIARPNIAGTPARQHPEVMKLRFDSKRSPFNGIPRDLRRDLYGLLMKHVPQAVKKQGAVWMEVDPRAPESLLPPFPFEAPSPMNKATATCRTSTPPAVADGFLLQHMTWPEVKDRLKHVDLALFPVGAIEQHGPHLPLDTDAFDAEYLARRVAERCSDPKPLVLPLMPYGVSYHHEDFSGTISVSNTALSRVVYEVGMSCARHGITKLVIINGHGGNSATLHFAAQMINRDAHIFVCVDSGETSDADIHALAETPNDVHAGEIETSTSLAVRPHLVRRDKVRRSVLRFSSRYLDFSSARGVGWYARTAKISPSGIMGDATKATVEKGRRMWEVMIRNLVEFVEQLKAMSLDEIHNSNRY